MGDIELTLSVSTGVFAQQRDRWTTHIRQPLAAVKTVADHLRNEADVELWHEPDTGILCFRIVPEGFPQGRLDQLQQTIYDRIMAEGKRSVSATRLDDCLVLRLVAISPSVTSQALLTPIRHTLMPTPSMRSKLLLI